MWRTTLLAFFLIGSVACGDDGGSSTADAALHDSPIEVDAAIDAPAGPAMITISGTVAEPALSGTTPIEGATVGAYRTSDEATALATTTTDANGNFSMTVNIAGVPLTGFLKSTAGGFVDTYAYPPAPLAADTTMFPINTMTTDNYAGVYILTQVTQTNGTGMIVVLVTDGSSAPVDDAVVSSSPASTAKYVNPQSGYLSPTETDTSPNGLAYLLNVPAGAVTVSATKTGSTFMSNMVKAFADALTTTVIIPQ